MQSDTQSLKDIEEPRALPAQARRDETNSPHSNRGFVSPYLSISNILVLAASVGILVFLWSLNYNKLGYFYDYSIMSDAAFKYASGLRPYRDFTTPIQSFSIWLAYASEVVFGPRYLALAYMNLVLALGLFFLVVEYVRRAFSFRLACLVAMALSVSSFLQHGIIWYNSIGLLLVSAVTLKGADLLRSRIIRTRDVVWMTALLLMVGLTKLNFFFVSILVIMAFAAVGAKEDMRLRGRKKNIARAVLFLALCGAPPIIETLANHVTFSTWLREVVLETASQRFSFLRVMLKPSFYIAELNPWWPGTILAGCVLICLVVYIVLASATVRQYREDEHKDSGGMIIRLGFICLFWVSAILLVVSNVDIESLSLSCCLLGVVAMGTSGQFSRETLKKSIRNSAILLGSYFLLVGTVSAARHARLSLTGKSFPGYTISKDGEPPYLRGVQLSHQEIEILADTRKLMDENPGVRVYWGPGLEILNRIYGGVTDPAFPLWYHLNASVKESDSPRINEAIRRSGAGLVVMDKMWLGRVPIGEQKYLEKEWSRDKDDDPLLVYRKKANDPMTVADAGH
jgi:hypothetical protein